MEGYPCSAGHTLAYISPYGDVFPCVQFPLPSGNVRRQKFLDIWNHSSELNEVRSIRAKDLHRVLRLQPCRHLHPLPRPRLHGRKHARTVNRRLRKVFPPHRNPLRQHASPGRRSAPTCSIRPSHSYPAIDSVIVVFSVVRSKFSDLSQPSRLDQAAKQRKIEAPGASPGSKANMTEPRRGERNRSYFGVPRGPRWHDGTGRET